MTEGADKSLGRGASIMAAGTAVSRVLGMVRTLLIVAVIGISPAADAFQLANKLPSVLYNLLISGALSAVLVPQVVRAYKRNAGQDYVDRLLTLGFTILLGLTVLLTVAIPIVVPLWGLGAAGPRLHLAIAFAYWTMPQLFFYGMYALLGQVLNARGSFGPFMWAPAANNLVAIAGLVVFGSMFGWMNNDAPGPEDWTSTQVMILGAGATLGIVAQGMILLPAMNKAGIHFRPRWGFRGVGLRDAGSVAGWTFVALLIGQTGTIAVSQAAASAGDVGERLGSAVAGQAAYDYAFATFMLPHSLVTLSLITALFPRLSADAADHDNRAVARSLSFGMRVVGVFTVIAGVLGVVLAEPLTRAVLPTANTTSVPLIAQVLAAFMVGLPAFGVWSVAQRVYYAYENARALIPVSIGSAAVVVAGTIGVRILLPAQLWVAGAALAISASYLLAAVMTLAGLKNRMGTIGGSQTLRTYLRTSLAAVPAGVVAWASLVGLHTLGMVDQPGLIGWLLAVGQCVVIGGIAIGVYLLGLRQLRVSELDPLLDRFRRLIGRLTGGRGV